MQFMTCQNYCWCSPGFVCAMSTTKFEDLPANSYFHCKFVLFQGVYYDNVQQEFKVAFHKWIGDKKMGGYTLAEIIKSHETSLSFVSHMFDEDLTVGDTRSVHLCYLNQIAGLLLEELFLSCFCCCVF